MSQRGLARESQQRLADYMSILRGSQTADLSAKNLGDEGFAYIIDALAFNEVCLAADFSKNGIGAVGASQLATVLPSNGTLRTLLLDTNAIGDEGAAELAKCLVGALGSVMRGVLCPVGGVSCPEPDWSLYPVPCPCNL